MATPEQFHERDFRGDEIRLSQWEASYSRSYDNGKNATYVELETWTPGSHAKRCGCRPCTVARTIIMNGPNPDPETPNPDPETPTQPEPERFFGLSVRTLTTLAAIFGGCIVLAVVVCNVVLKGIEQFTPGPTPVPVPTWTPVPTFTPVPQPTATPKPIADLPLQQLHYNQYRIFHLIYEYQKCYEAHIRPPAPTPTPQSAEDGVPPTPPRAHAGAGSLRGSPPSAAIRADRA